MDKKTNISAKLQEIKKENSFSVPPGYFNGFQQRLQERINAEKAAPKHEKEGLRVPRLVWISAMAAVFVLAIYIARNIAGTDSPLSKEEIALAFEQDIYDLDEFILMENMREVRQDFEPANGYSEEIIRYLLDEDIEIDEIVNEL